LPWVEPKAPQADHGSGKRGQWRPADSRAAGRGHFADVPPAAPPVGPEQTDDSPLAGGRDQTSPLRLAPGHPNPGGETPAPGGAANGQASPPRLHRHSPPGGKAAAGELHHRPRRTGRGPQHHLAVGGGERVSGGQCCKRRDNQSDPVGWPARDCANRSDGVHWGTMTDPSKSTNGGSAAPRSRSSLLRPPPGRIWAYARPLCTGSEALDRHRYAGVS
jgi:hypothetical protein